MSLRAATKRCRKGRPGLSAYQGLRVLDFSQGVAGPMATMLLGDFGAEIIKIEPLEGDRLKSHPGYQAWNRNKGILSAELGDPSVQILIAQADLSRGASLGNLWGEASVERGNSIAILGKELFVANAR